MVNNGVLVSSSIMKQEGDKNKNDEMGPRTTTAAAAAGAAPTTQFQWHTAHSRSFY
jgi:hypothetical protein